MTIELHPIVLLFIAGVAFFVGMICRSMYPAVTRDQIRFTTTHGDNHEQS